MAQQTYCTFYLNDQLFGLNILLVREITRHLDITPVQHAADFVRGLTNLRGQIVTVLDLKRRLSMGNCNIDHETLNIILKSQSEMISSHVSDDLPQGEVYVGDDKVGLMVDRVGEVMTVDVAEIEPSPANIGNVEGKYLSGVVKLKKHGLLGILSSEKVLELAQ